MNLYIKQKVFSIGDRYQVFNETQQPIFNVQSKVFSIGAKIHIFDLIGEELFYIEQKLFRFLPEYHIFNQTGPCAVVKKEFSLFKPKLFIESQYGDYRIEGNLWGMDFAIWNGDRLVGEIHKVWLSFGDSYELMIEDPNDAAFFSTLVIAIDHCIHNENRN